MLPFRGAIFDLDGVLVDTVPQHFWAWQTMFGTYGIAFDEEDYRQKVDGRTRLDGVRAVMPEADEATVIAAAERKQALFLERLALGGLTVFESSVRLVHMLADEGILLAVASSSANLRPILVQAGTAHRFSSMVSGADIVNGKPDPEIFLKAATQLGLSAHECVVFEDATSGVLAAKRGGFYCVGIDRHERPSSFQEADIVIRDLVELDYARLFIPCASTEPNPSD